jgi:hypothetical protein
MPPPSRTGRTLKWCGTTIFLLTAALWAASGWYYLDWYSAGGKLAWFRSGALEIGVWGQVAAAGQGFSAGRYYSMGHRWWFEYTTSGEHWKLSIPLWLLIVLFAPSLLLWRSRLAALRRALTERPRLSSSLFLAAALISASLSIAWLWSGWRAFAWQSASGFGVALDQGSLGIGPIRPNIGVSRFRTSTHPFQANLRFREILRGPSAFEVVPLWPFALLALGGTVVLARIAREARRRPKRPRCAKCRYDLTGLPPHSRCPECGRSTPT